MGGRSHKNNEERGEAPEDLGKVFPPDMGVGAGGGGGRSRPRRELDTDYRQIETEQWNWDRMFLNAELETPSACAFLPHESSIPRQTSLFKPRSHFCPQED